jgi:hypothetical protein
MRDGTITHRPLAAAVAHEFFLGLTDRGPGVSTPAGSCRAFRNASEILETWDTA